MPHFLYLTYTVQADTSSPSIHRRTDGQQGICVRQTQTLSLDCIIEMDAMLLNVHTTTHCMHACSDTFAYVPGGHNVPFGRVPP